ncbi:MAG: protein kinase domain-containing protein, partial [Myxococcales bacterium]
MERHGSPESLKPGSLVGRFELVKEIGRGGFGVVWEAKDRELGRAVALKALLAGRPDVREERLLREAEAAARLTHPNIVTIFDVGRTDDGPYLVLELLRGETLAARLEQGTIAVREALRIAVEVATGLAHAHARGVVHRDLTPGNVFLCEDAQVKILDLGMAHAFGRRKLDGGTPTYMAPEQVEGAPEDERTDVFALGVVLYRMLSGDVPYPGARDGRWNPPPELDVADAPALGGLLRSMLAPRRTDRPRDASHVLRALSQFEKELERAGSSATPVRRRRRAHVALFPLLVLVIAGTVIAATASKWERAPTAAQVKPSIAVLPFADLSPQHDQEYFADGVAEEILNGLARVDGLRVPARTSSFYFKGKNVELADIGRKLNVTHVLEGSVRKNGSRVRVAAQIVNVADGYHLWSDTFDGDLTDIFAVQDQFTKAVVSALKVRLLSHAAIASAPPRNTEAYTQYLLGRHLFYRNSDDDVAQALSHFGNATTLDPDYAPAWAYLSFAITQRAWWAGSASAEDQERALTAAEKAIALAPEEAVGYLARTFLRHVVLWDWAGAQADVQRAFALNKTYYRPENQHALLLATLGRTREAVTAGRSATEYDPLNAAFWGNLANYYIAMGDLALARAATTRALELSPERFRYRLGMIELLGGSPAAAAAEFGKCAREPQRLSGLSMAKHDLGSAEESEQALGTLISRYGSKDPYIIAQVYARRGERDRVFEWLQR